MPTDDAFEASGITTQAVGNVPVEILTNILLYHLLEGAASAEVISTATDFYTALQVWLRDDVQVTTSRKACNFRLWTSIEEGC